MKVLVCMTDDELAELCEKTGLNAAEIAYELDNYEELRLPTQSGGREGLGCPIEIVVV